MLFVVLILHCPHFRRQQRLSKLAFSNPGLRRRCSCPPTSTSLFCSQLPDILTTHSCADGGYQLVARCVHWACNRSTVLHRGDRRERLPPPSPATLNTPPAAPASSTTRPRRPRAWRHPLVRPVELAQRLRQRVVPSTRRLAATVVAARLPPVMVFGQKLGRPSIATRRSREPQSQSTRPSAPTNHDCGCRCSSCSPVSAAPLSPRRKRRATSRARSFECRQLVLAVASTEVR